MSHFRSFLMQILLLIRFFGDLMQSINDGCMEIKTRCKNPRRFFAGNCATIFQIPPDIAGLPSAVAWSHPTAEGVPSTSEYPAPMPSVGQWSDSRRGIKYKQFAAFMNIETNKVIQRQQIGLTRKRVLAVLGICLLCLPAFAGSNEEKPMADMAQYDKTIGDTRVVLLAITSVSVLASTHSTSNEIDTTNLEITFITEHIGTNSTKNLEAGSVILYLQNKGQKETPLDFNGTSISTGPGVNVPPPLPQVQVTDKGACYTTHVILKRVTYHPNVRINCLIQRGFDGQLKDFRFNDILLP